MFRCSILAIFGLLLPLSAQTAEPTGSGHSASATQKKDRTRCSDSAADELMTSMVPHPYVYLAPSLMPAGYAIGAIRSEVGLNVESCYLHADVGAAYDNGRAANDNDPPNPKGHDRYFDGRLDFRPRWLFSGGGFVGVGWRSNQYSTTNYTKSGSRPQFGGGYDLIQRPCPTCHVDFSVRIEGSWFTAGNDRQDGSHGLEISMSIPSPRERRHLFYQERIAIFSFHGTVPVSDNTPSAVSARAHRSLTCSVNFGILYRF